MLLLTWLYTVQHDERPRPIPLTAVTYCTYRSISLSTSTRSIMFFISTLSWPLAILVYLRKLLCMKYELSKHSSLSVQYPTFLLPMSFSPGTPKAPVMPVHFLSHIHPFRSPRMHDLYPFPMLSSVMPVSFQNMSLLQHSLGPYPITTQTLTLKNFNVIQRLL